MDTLDKKYYKISEVAQILGVAPSTLRFWESQFSIVKPHRNDKGTRFYTPKDIETIKMIYYLVKEKGLKLDAAQAQIKRNHSGVSRKFETIERLKLMRHKLQSLIDAIDSRVAKQRNNKRNN